MADEQQLDILIRQGVEVWNAWRQEHPAIKVDFRKANLSDANLIDANLSAANLIEADLSRANLSKANLSEANLSEANLHGADLIRANLIGANLSCARLHSADLSGAHLHGANLFNADLHGANLSFARLSKANLYEADLRGAHLHGARFSEANLRGVDLGGANLRGAHLSKANLYEADLHGANLGGADLSEANLHKTNLGGADLHGANLRNAFLVDTRLANTNLTGCRVYGMSAWDLDLEGARQADLVITRDGQPKVTVDNLEVAQFIYLLLNNERVRHVIDTITSKVVLILGRFTPERKAVLDALREDLRKRDYLPVLFDFEKPGGKDLTGTIQTLANMARFVIADLTDPSSVPHELAMIVPGTVVPVQPILLEGQREYAMFMDLKRRHHWVLEPYRYDSPERLIADLGERVIGPAESKAGELRIASQN